MFSFSWTSSLTVCQNYWNEDLLIALFIEAYANMDIRIIFERTSDTIFLCAVEHHDVLKNL